MPQTSSAKKALRSSLRRRSINDRWRARLRAALKDLRLAIVSGKKEPAATAFLAAQKMLDRAAQHSIISKQTAARKKSRLSATIAKLA